ncbi:butyrophilin subfamily 2 member A1-like [Xenopus laevis]|uniref:Butyrophilin subfamily 2 member A1-like n=1 Tax=Xenopus laevis TaxID=8355 RepID=A0A8J1LJ43_XENLA|nr:butyrophilin subfamily 2 member A1-like [Xenopus laevis]
MLSPITHRPLFQLIIIVLQFGSSNVHNSGDLEGFQADGHNVRFMVSSVSPVSAPFSSDATLHCSLVPEMNAEKMLIVWFRNIYPPYVHMYNRGEEDKLKQMEQFAHRTKLLKQNITRGAVALLIQNVTFEDCGAYYCYFESDDHHGRGTVELNVTEIKKSSPETRSRGRILIGHSSSNNLIPGLHIYIIAIIFLL